MQSPFVANLLWRALAIFFLIGASTGTIMALLLIFKPQLLKRISAGANQWISMRRISLWMDLSVRTERWFYRQHRVLGPLVVLGAGYLVLHFGVLLDRAEALRALGARLASDPLASILMDAAVSITVVGAIAALLLGGIYWIRPSLLRGIETRANQWVSSRQATKAIDIAHDQVDLFVEHHAHRVGWLLLAASIYLFVTMVRWLL